jgi:RNA polymerase sigma-70 factor (ECF subfamily)
MDQQQQREIAEGLRSGRTDAWQGLYDIFAERVWRWVARLLGSNSADVADVVQETFLAAARSARTYDPDQGSLWPWLIGIARNHVALHYRKRKRQERVGNLAGRLPSAAGGLGCSLSACDEAPLRSLAAAERSAMVRAVLSELPAEYGDLLVAKYCDGVSVEQLAAQEDCSPTAVRSRLARARRAFRRAFAKDTNPGCDNI